MNPDHAKEILFNIFPEKVSKAGLIKLWNDEEIKIGQGQPVFSIHIKNQKIFEEILVEPSLAFGEGYINGDIEIVGNVGEVLEWLFENATEQKLTPYQKAKVCWLHLKRRATIKQTKKDVQTHYDKGNDFYKLWLDQDMNYSCAFFRTDDEDIDQAQKNKIIRSLKKLMLKPNHKLLDIGCGWGSLVIYAAKTFGTKTVGITLSENQYELAKERVKKEGLEELVEIRLQDYREISKNEEKSFDRIISIGMFEHVGKENIPVFFEKCAKLLKPKGMMLLHTISRIKESQMDPWLTKYIFPGTYVPALKELVETAEDTGFDFIDIENLRRHYDKTLGHWASRFEKHAKKIKEKYGEKFIKTWRLYLYGCQMAFRYNPLFVFQILFSLGRRNDLPLVREELYS